MAIAASIGPTFRFAQVARWWAMLVVVLSAVFALPGCGHYDELVAKDQECQKRWSDVEANLQRRYDLIPNLVETVKASGKLEKDILEGVTKARAEATSFKVDESLLTDPEAMKKFTAAQSKLSGELSRLLVSVEKYPDLKSTQGFRDLQVQLEGTENRILRAREKYNESVADYNATLGKISGQVVNKVTGKPFKPREFFKADAAATGAAPKVSF